MTKSKNYQTSAFLKRGSRKRKWGSVAQHNQEEEDCRGPGSHVSCGRYLLLNQFTSPGRRPEPPGFTLLPLNSPGGTPGPARGRPTGPSSISWHQYSCVSSCSVSCGRVQPRSSSVSLFYIAHNPPPSEALQSTHPDLWCVSGVNQQINTGSQKVQGGGGIFLKRKTHFSIVILTLLWMRRRRRTPRGALGWCHVRERPAFSGPAGGLDLGIRQWGPTSGRGRWVQVFDPQRHVNEYCDVSCVSLFSVL